jgi:hypothetical protein
MKKSILLLVLVAAFQLAHAQKTDSTLFKGVTRILISNNKTAEENYKLCGQIMLDQGYNIGSKDSEFLQIASEPVRVFGQGVTHMFSVYTVSKDHQITITGKSKSLSSFNESRSISRENAFNVVPYQNKLISKNIYEKLNKYVAAFKDSKITYSE